MRKTFLTGVGIWWLVGVACVLPAVRAQEASFFSDITFDAALKQADEQKKIVLVDFFTTWCGPCKMLDKTTWTDAKVAALLSEKTVALKIDAEKEEALARKYKINVYPTVLLLKPDGAVIDQLVGYRPPGAFIEDFNSAMKGKTSLNRAQESAKADGALDPMKRGRLGDELARSGQKEEALREYLWCYDEGLKHAPSYVGVRGSFLLSHIAQLGKSYPPALEALRTRRDAARQSLVNDPSNRAAAGDLASLNNVLGDNAATLALFDQLPASSPIRAAIGYHVFDLLLEAKRYADAAAAMPYERFIRRFDHAMKNFKGKDASMIEYQCKSAAKELEALAGSGKLDESRELIKKILDADRSEETITALRQHLERAGRSDLLPKLEPDATKSGSPEKP